MLTKTPVHPWLILLVLSGNMLIDALEVSTSVIAMPAIATTFGLSPRWAASVMVAFAAGFGGTILLAARLAARIGRRRTYLVAVAVFGVASLLGAIAVDVETLLVTRFVKGICVALTVPIGLAVIAVTFPAGAPRNRALSIYSLFGASGFSVGLVLAGVLTPLSWRWTMAFGGPVALALLPVAAGVVPADPPAPPPGDAAAVPVLRGGSGVLHGVWRAALGGAVLNGAFWGFLLIATFELQRQRSLAPLAAGLLLLPASVPLIFSTMYAPRLSARFGTERLILAGSLAAAAGYLLFSLSGQDMTALLCTVVLIGLAFALSFPALNAGALAGADPARRGVAGRYFQTTVQFGGILMLVAVAWADPAAHRLASAVVAVAATAGVLIAVSGVSATRIPAAKE